MKLAKHLHLWLLLGLLLADGLVFGFTNPNNVASIALMGGFLLCTTTVYVALRASLVGVEVYGLNIKRKRRLAVVMTAVIGSLVALQSIGQLSSRDILVVLPLVVIAYLYTSYGKNQTSTS